MVASANKKRRELEFKEGDLVWLKLRPHRQTSLIRRANQKLAAKYFGPFKVLKRMGAVAYQLELPATAKIHPVFHVSLLKRVIGEHQAIIELPPELVLEAEEFVPSNIVKVVIHSGGSSACHKVLVEWDGKPREEASWMTCEEFKNQIPTSNLVDKVCSIGGGIVSTQAKCVGPYIVYSKRAPKESVKGNVQE